jgi:hypothetical protein
LASTCSFLCVVALASRFVREPNSLSLRFFITGVPCGEGEASPVAPRDRLASRPVGGAGWWGIPAHDHLITLRLI